jgi:hypothetical protein
MAVEIRSAVGSTESGGRRAGALKDFQIRQKGIQTFPEGNPSFFGRKSNENRKEIQAFVFRGSSLFKDLRRPPTAFLFLKLLTALEAARRPGLARSPQVVCRSFCLRFWSSGLMKRVKGWRLFRSRTHGRRLPDLAAASCESAKREPGSGGIPGHEPGTKDLAKKQADRSDVRQEFARKRARTGFEPNRKADRRQPFMPRMSLEPLPFDASLPFCPCDANATAFVERIERAFHPAMDHHDMITVMCK